jgi:hypothetical protein
MDRAIIWVRSTPVTVADESFAVKTSIIHFVAIHADLLTLRGGTSYVLGTCRMFCKECSVLKHNNDIKKRPNFLPLLLSNDEEQYQSAAKLSKCSTLTMIITVALITIQKLQLTLWTTSVRN